MTVEKSTAFTPSVNPPGRKLVVPEAQVDPLKTAPRAVGVAVLPWKAVRTQPLWAMFKGVPDRMPMFTEAVAGPVR